MKSHFRAGLIMIAGAAVSMPLARRWYLRWGASDEEVRETLPGDELIARPDLTATRAITIGASPARVWPWIAQLGQGRGGFYSYDVPANLIGCDIHSASRIVPEWQHITAGEQVRLHPDVPLGVAAARPARELVLHGAIAIGDSPPSFDSTWAFILRARQSGATRLIVRVRYTYRRRWARLMIEPVEMIDFVMARKMLRGVKSRAEQAA